MPRPLFSCSAITLVAQGLPICLNKTRAFAKPKEIKVYRHILAVIFSGMLPLIGRLGSKIDLTNKCLKVQTAN